MCGVWEFSFFSCIFVFRGRFTVLKVLLFLCSRKSLLLISRVLEIVELFSLVK